MRHSEARRVLNRHCVELDGKAASSNHSVSKDQNGAAATAAWWIANDSSSPPADSPRSRAYLRAYHEIAGPRFFATGIPLDDGYMLPDRGVMKALLEGGYVVLTNERSPRFEVTERGRALIGV